MKITLPKINVPRYISIDDLPVGSVFGNLKKELPVIPQYLYDSLNEDIYVKVEPQKPNMVTLVQLGDKYGMVHRLPSTMVYEIPSELDDSLYDNYRDQRVTLKEVNYLKSLLPGQSFILVNKLPFTIKSDEEEYIVITNVVADNKNITCLNLEYFTIHTFDPDTIVFGVESNLVLSEPKTQVFEPDMD